ncbi:MAG: YlbF family regulator [Pedosphaera sp.]|nr:YlbF family regulator [Pedosphaera sp.]
MQTIATDSVIEKTRELCQTIMDQPEFREIRERIETFMNDESAKAQYQSLSERGEHLQHNQTQGVKLSDEEIADFERQRSEFFGNTVSRGFMDAQQAMHKMQETVGQYVSKTYELGRVPEAEDFDSGDCGPSCGCSH